MNKSPHRVKRNLLVSLLLLLLAALFFWAMLDFAMPTPALAHRRAAAEYGLDPGRILLSRPVHFQEGASDHDDQWVLSQSKDGYLVSTLARVGPLWTSPMPPMLLIPTAEQPIMYVCPASGFLLNETDSQQPILDAVWEYVTLVVTSDPAVDRVELFQGGTATGGDGKGAEVDWLVENAPSIDCVETTPGSGLWVGQQVVRASYGFGYPTTYIRTYGADGKVLGQLLPDAYLRFDGI